MAACGAMVLLALVVGTWMFFVRVGEMRARRIHPQAAANSLQVAERLQKVQAADNFRNMFEVPVLFYALVAVALASGQRARLAGGRLPGSSCCCAMCTA